MARSCYRWCSESQHCLNYCSDHTLFFQMNTSKAALYEHIIEQCGEIHPLGLNNLKYLGLVGLLQLDKHCGQKKSKEENKHACQILKCMSNTLHVPIWDSGGNSQKTKDPSRPLWDDLE